MTDEELVEARRRMEAYDESLRTDPKYQAKQRKIRNRNRFNDIYAVGDGTFSRRA